MNVTVRRFLSIFLMLAIAAAPLRLGIAFDGDADSNTTDRYASMSVNHTAMPDCLKAAHGECSLMGFFDSGKVDCSGVSCNFCQGPLSLNPGEFALSIALSPAYLFKQFHSPPDTIFSTSPRPPKRLS